MTTRPVLKCFPTADRRFEQDAVMTLRTLGDVPDARNLESTLRRWYPSCVVREQHDLATLVEGPQWYLYRDGSVRPRFRRSERLYEALGNARDLIAGTLAAVDRAAGSPVADRKRLGSQAQALHERFDREATKHPPE